MRQEVFNRLTKENNTFGKNGAFFAFSKEQFTKGKGDHHKDEIVRLGAGLYCPKINAKKLIKEIDELVQQAGLEVIEKYGWKRYLNNEYDNHETDYIGDLQSFYDAVCSTPGFDWDKFVHYCGTRKMKRWTKFIKRKSFA